MGAHALRPENLEEQIVYLTILSTWGFWLLGALFVVGPILGLGLGLLVLARRMGIGEHTAVARAWMPIPMAIRLWIVGMLVMYVALFVAHIDEGLGTVVLLKSSVGWIKGWLLLALFPLAGALLQIRPEIIVRAIALLAVQTLALMPLFVASPQLGLPETLYVSPLLYLGGPGPEFFDVTLHDTDVITKRYRWRFFSPWATLAALYAILWLVLVTRERQRGLQALAVVSAIGVCLLSQSRLAFVAIPAALLVVFVLSHWSSPKSWMVAAFAAAIIILASDSVIEAYHDFSDQFRGARAASSQVRDKLAAIAYHRWHTEAPLFGHGILERGPYIVHYMLIGSHHTWIGLLYVKGAVGFLALAVPMAWTAIALIRRALVHRLARSAMAALFAIFLGSFGDNLEVTTYIIWPVLIIIGIALRRRPATLITMKLPVSSSLGSLRAATQAG